MSMRGFGIENWLKSTKVDTKNMSKKKKKKQKLKKEAEDVDDDDDATVPGVVW